MADSASDAHPSLPARRREAERVERLARAAAYQEAAWVQGQGEEDSGEDESDDVSASWPGRQSIQPADWHRRIKQLWQPTGR